MELVDIGDLKSPGVKAVQVRVLSPIPNMESYSNGKEVALLKQ